MNNEHNNQDHNEEDKPPQGVHRPKSLKEARKRRRKVRDTMKDIEMQLADPNMTDKAGKRMTLTEWELWKSRAYRVLRRTQAEFSYLEYWIDETRRSIRANEAGIKNHLDPNAHLNTARHLLRSIRKCEALPKELHDRTGRVADSIEAYLTHDAEVA